MNIGKAFTYPFEDKEWATKAGLGALITLVPILNFAAVGWAIEIMRRVERDDPQPLPGWENFEKKFLDGLFLTLAGVIYSLPLIVLIFVMLALVIIPAVLASQNQNAQTGISILVAGVGIIGGALILLYSLGLSILYPAVYLEYARKGTFSACFNFKEIFARIGKNTGVYFTAWAVYLGSTILVSGVGGALGGMLGWIPCLGILITVPVSLALGIYIVLIYGHLFGQYAALDAPQPPATV